MSNLQIDTETKFPQGFSCASKCCGLKADGAHDLSLFYSEVPANAAAVFTKNLIPGAPIILGREIIKKGELQAIVVNSKVSNVGTGQPGVDNARRMGSAAAKELDCGDDSVLMSSTGVIAVPLPVEKIEAGLVGMKSKMSSDPLLGAKGIMTTDTYPKAISISQDGWRLTIVGKGSGMIEPNMATMLVYVFTDAQLTSDELDQALRQSVNKSFNMLSIDADTSTSDTVAIMANGLGAKAGLNEFQEALDFACIQMTKMLALDGEGATKLIRAIVEGATSEQEAKIFAKAIINSPLIKTMAHGCDPNIGRLLMAIGKCFDNTVDYEKIELEVNGIKVFANTQKLNFDEQALRQSIDSKAVDFKVKLNLGSGSSTAYGCDLTHGYVDENAAYYSS